MVRWRRSDDAPCNSRVMLEVNDQEYNILNFNCYLIKEWYAGKICLALRNKGFKSRVEVVGDNATPEVYKYKPPERKEQAIEVEPKKEEVKPKTYKQVTLFEYINASGY